MHVHVLTQRPNAPSTLAPTESEVSGMDIVPPGAAPAIIMAAALAYSGFVIFAMTR